MHEWATTEILPSPSRKREIELERRAPETVELDVHLRNARSQKLKALHARVESGQRRRLFNLDRDLKNMRRAHTLADSHVQEAFGTDWRRHIDEVVDKMRSAATEVHCEAPQASESQDLQSASHIVI